jgi:uncharacterized protein YyaL (SSP411 family)
MANRLANETSPYLLQHKDNPVDWYPWGDEALNRAKNENKPILLSIGYSACHWCHVMEHESFENAEIARLMNENFVCIKVDREERPDLDSIYMQVTTAMTGGGGWPMTVFLTPEGVPYYAGTYFPPHDRYNIPGFPRVLDHVARAYRERPDDVARTTAQVRDLVSGRSGLSAAARKLDPGGLEEAFRSLGGQYDRQNGGFGGAPKFPPSMALEFLLRYHRRSGDKEALAIVEHTLERMARGGIYDQLGGGFHRYSVDAHWLAPHFEKMLYDNALLVRSYLMAYQVTRERFYARIAEETLDWVVREMTSPEGGFYSTLDADSEGVEGKFYVWSGAALVEAIGPEDAEIAARFWDVSEHGNWEHTNILNVADDPAVTASALKMRPDELRKAIERIRPKLLAAREKRVRPGRDDKVLTSWNGLMLRTFAEAANVLRADRFRRAAIKNAEFVLSTLRVDGRLRHSYKDGQAKFNAYLEDYAYYADGLISLYEATFDRRWLEEARSLVDTMLAHYRDEADGGFFDTSDDHEALISRPKDLYDNATPSANSVAAEALLRLALLTGDEPYERVAIDSLERVGHVAAQAPTAFGRWLCAIDWVLGQPLEIAVVGPGDSGLTRNLLEVVWQRFLPNKVVALREPWDDEIVGLVPLLEGRDEGDGKPTAYVCRNRACQMPTNDPRELAKQLDGAAQLQ